MTSNETIAYLKQVVNLEQQLMQLRAVSDELKLHSHTYQTIGTEAHYRIKSHEQVKRLVECLDKPVTIDSDHIRRTLEKEDNPQEYPALFAVIKKQDPQAVKIARLRGEPTPPSTVDVYKADYRMKESMFYEHYTRPQIDQDTIAHLSLEPQEPVAVATTSYTNRSKILSTGIVFTLFFLLLAFVAKTPETALLTIPCIAFLCWLADCRIKVKNKEYDDYMEEKVAYENAVAQKKQATETVITCLEQAYSAAAEKASNAYRTLSKNRIQMIQTEASQINALIGECERTLQQLYAQDIVHPKYRNLSACCMFLEYFESGRCETLTGANGAYNLYESELRQNLIIYKLEEVVQRLDDLKATMYRCCRALESVSQKLDVVHRELHNLNTKAQKQLELSALTTVYSAATAANTSAIKYLALVK